MQTNQAISIIDLEIVVHGDGRYCYCKSRPALWLLCISSGAKRSRPNENNNGQFSLPPSLPPSKFNIKRDGQSKERVVRGQMFHENEVVKTVVFTLNEHNNLLFHRSPDYSLDHIFNTLALHRVIIGQLRRL